MLINFKLTARFRSSCPGRTPAAEPAASAALAPANPGAAKPQPPSSVSPSGVQTRNASADFMLGGEVAGTP
jgi:hypothetical protein